MNTSLVAIVLALSTGLAFTQDAAPSPVPLESSIVMPSGRTLKLPGAWTEAKTLGGEHALVFTRWMHDHRGLVSLDAGASEPRVIAALGHRQGLPEHGTAWAPDGSACYAWLDMDSQLSRIDARTGEITSLTSFPTHLTEWCVETSDLAPDARPGGVVAMNGLLLFVVREEALQTSSRYRSGESWLVALDPADRSIVDLSRSRWTSGLRDAWEISPSRKAMYRTANRQQRICATTFDGAPLWEAPYIWEYLNGWPVETLVLSPDERTLLLERDDNPEISFPTGGCGLLNLDDHVLRKGTFQGYGFAWSPDSKRIAFLQGQGRNLCIYDVESDAIETLASLHRTESTATWTRPIWSPDGRMLFTNIGEENGHHQAFDLVAQTILVIDCGVEGANYSFAPVAKPFPGN